MPLMIDCVGLPPFKPPARSHEAAKRLGFAKGIIGFGRVEVTAPSPARLAAARFAPGCQRSRAPTQANHKL